MISLQGVEGREVLGGLHVPLNAISVLYLRCNKCNSKTDTPCVFLAPESRVFSDENKLQSTMEKGSEVTLLLAKLEPDTLIVILP